MASTLEQEIRDLRSRFWSERDPDGRAFAPLADACRRAGQLDEARALVDEGLDRLPEFTPGHMVAAWLDRDTGDLTSAEAGFRRVLELDPENARALHGLGQLLARRGRVAAGRELVGRAVALDPLLEWEEGAGPAAPDEEAEPSDERPVVPVAELAPSVEAAPGAATPAPVRNLPGVEGAVVDIRSLAPEPDVRGMLGRLRSGTAVVEIASLAPAERTPGPDPRPIVDVGDLAPDEDTAAPDDVDEPELYTRTLAELYARQGFPERAVAVYRVLAERAPSDAGLRERLAELESALGTEAPPARETGMRAYLEEILGPDTRRTASEGRAPSDRAEGDTDDSPPDDDFTTWLNEP